APERSGGSSEPAQAAVSSNEAEQARSNTANSSESPPAAAATSAASASTSDVWGFQREQRRQAETGKSNHDIGFQRPTMELMRPVLALLDKGGVTGGELFDAYEPLRRDPNRPIVGYLRIPTGRHTNSIEESKALKAILFDNHQNGTTQSLADLVQIRKDLANQQLILAMSSLESIDRITGAAFKLPVRDGHQTFTAESSHAMDGFYIDILDFAHDRAAERYLWTIMAAWNAPPIAGGYAHVSASLGAKTSRYRLTFARDDAPPLLYTNGRLVDEIIFQGKCYRKALQRTDLDIAAKEKRITLPNSQASSDSQASRSTSDNKCQRLATPPKPNPWRRVQSGAKDQESSTPQPWTSPNIFDVLRQHVVVTPMLISTADGTTKMIVPQILSPPDAPQRAAEDAFVGGTKVESSKANSRRLTVKPKQAEDICNRERDCKRAIGFSLSRYITEGEADWIQRELESNPINFGHQLSSLVKEAPTLLPQFIRLRLLCRWFRATWGSATPFCKLYRNMFGHKFSLDLLQDDFNDVRSSSDLVDHSHELDDDEVCVLASDAEAILSLGEVVLGTLAPLYYKSDAALNVATNFPIFSIPTRGGNRLLASTNIKQVLTTSSFSSKLWEQVRDLLETAASAAQQQFEADTSENEVEMEECPASTLMAEWARDMDKMLMLDLSAAAIFKDKTHLIGFYTPAHVDKESLHNVVSDQLPVYMVPAVWVGLDVMPMSTNDKIDKKALEQYDFEMEADDLVTENEHKLAKVWSEVLGVPLTSIRRQTSFFALGGDSISVITVVSACKQFGLYVSVPDFMRASILWRVAAVVSTSTADVWPSISLAQDVTDEIRNEWSSKLCMDNFLGYPVTPLQAGMIYATLLNPSAYVLQTPFKLKSMDTVQKLRCAFERVVATHEILRTTFVATSAGVYQVIPLDTWTVDIETTSASSLDEFLKSDYTRGFELGDKQFIRMRFVHIADNVYAVLTVHHALYDGWSLPMLLNDLKDAFYGATLMKRPNFRCVVDYVAAQDESKTQLFWHTYLYNVDDTSALSKVSNEN
ncbi:unnamed protein product, partial [Aphanomyces euteiches]